ncbi:MAG: 16S rRNA (cytosine(1402)-N(4))-methyltransferase RsmH [Proteobacteria bacterium]|nr:16S rRNA (cytosine(1402)-N(4))-methyltransferase RsmH [Pseudomonadota bacterium]
MKMGPASPKPSDKSAAGAHHTPVLLAEVLAALAPKDGEIYIDGTFGAGGYAKALLEAADCTVWGLDRDPKAVALGNTVARHYAGRLGVVAGRYGDMEELLAPVGVDAVDGVAFDLGASSMQLDDAGRGFSFRHDGPLNMRMEATGATAADAVNSLGEGELSDIIYNYGEDRAARRIAKAIVRARDRAPIERTGALADIVRGALRAKGARGGKRRGAIDPATRTFQALRIYVNDELNELDRGLLAAEAMLKPGGRLAVVAFHSLEDRRVKSFFSIRCGASARPSRHTPSLSSRGTSRAAAPSFHLLNRRVIKPGPEEIARNPRARSARLRAAVRTEAPPWPASAAQ